MTLEELKDKCEVAIAFKGVIDLPGPATISLKLPEAKQAPRQRRIFGKTGPMGNVVAWGFDGFDTVVFNAKEVLDFIKKVEANHGKD
jgi:hypothetical protein